MLDNERRCNMSQDIVLDWVETIKAWVLDNQHNDIACVIDEWLNLKDVDDDMLINMWENSTGLQFDEEDL